MARQFRAPRMLKEWLPLPGTAADLTASGTLVAMASLVFTGPGTILRMIGEYVIFPTAPLVAGDEAVVQVGIGIFSSDAVTLGATALPEPFGDVSYAGWLYTADHPFGANAAVEESALALMSIRKHFDVKSMRKFRTDQTIAMVAMLADVGSGGAPPMTIVAGGTKLLGAI